jgi:transcriptional regulator with XRE-family HTH domain
MSEVKLQTDTHLKIIEIRKYRGLSQKEVASWYGITAQSWGAKEKGETAGFSPADLALFVQKTEIDARWLFGQIDCRIEEADFRLHRPEQSLMREMTDEVRALRKLTKPLKDIDPIAEKVMVDAQLRQICEVLVKNRDFIQRTIGYLDAMQIQETPAKREHA